MAPNQKPSLAARIFQGGGSAGLLGDPLFNIGMGLLAKGQDNRIPYATAVMGGLQDAQGARQQAQQREMLRQQQERESLLRELQLQAQLQERQRGELARSQYQQALQSQFPDNAAMRQTYGLLGPSEGAQMLLQRGQVPGQRGALFNRLQQLANSGQTDSPDYAYIYNELSGQKTTTLPGGATMTQPGNPLTGLPRPSSATVSQQANQNPASNQEPASNVVESKEQIKDRKGIRATITSYNNYLDKVQKIGRPTNVTELNSIDAAYQDLLLEAKELYTLGVLAGPDLDLLTSITPSLTTMSGFVRGPNAAIQQLQAALLSRLESAIKGYEKDYKATWDEARPIRVNFGTEIDVEGDKEFFSAEFAAEHANKLVEYKGKRYRSDGTKWTEQ